MSGVELLDVDRFVWDALSGDAALGALFGGTGDAMRAYNLHAPLGSVFPLIIYGILPDSQTDTNGVAGARIFTEARYMAKVVGETADPETLRDGASRLDALLHQASATVNGTTVLSIIRDGPLNYPETLEGVEYRHVGHVFRVWAHS